MLHMTVQQSSHPALFTIPQTCCPPTTSQINPVNNNMISLTSWAWFHLPACWESPAFPRNCCQAVLSIKKPIKQKNNQNKQKKKNPTTYCLCLSGLGAKIKQASHQKCWVASSLSCSWIQRSLQEQPLLGMVLQQVSRLPPKNRLFLYKWYRR